MQPRLVGRSANTQLKPKRPRLTPEARPLHTTLVTTSEADDAPKGIRIPVAALKGLCPRPLDDGGRLIRFYAKWHAGSNKCYPRISQITQTGHPELGNLRMIQLHPCATARRQCGGSPQAPSYAFSALTVVSVVAFPTLTSEIDESRNNAPYIANTTSQPRPLE